MDRLLKFIKKLNKTDAYNILERVELILANETKKLNPKKLKGFRDYYRIRYKNYRIVYQKLKSENLIISVGHRKNIYKK
jgi:mRNA-degrading endonuclease RelE of RelBE toxin-antitoxin system